MKTKLLLLLSLSFLISYSQVPTSDLIKEYTFTNGSFSNTIDPGVNDITSQTVPSSYASTSDPLSQTNDALSLNGDELSAGQHPTSAIINSSFSVSFWIKTTNSSVNSSYIFQQYGTSGSFGAGIRTYIQNGKLSFVGNYRLGTSNSFSTNATVTSSVINDGNWHHVVITGFLNKRSHPTATSFTLIKYDYKIYLDNVLDASGSTTDQIDYNQDAYLMHGTPDLIIGSSGFQDDLDNFRMYTNTLSVTDVDNLYKEFVQNYSLTTSTSNGTIATDVQPTNGQYTNGTTVELTATPNPGYQFLEWSGDASGTTNPLSVVMDANKTITAVFTTTLNFSDIELKNSTVFIDAGILKISSNSTLEYVDVFTLTGAKVAYGTSKEIVIDHLSTGIYVVRVQTKNGMFIKKIVKN